ncbi:MAG: HAD family hydrolase [Thermotogota bacterium]|nr:HAD family hydrolase [Thermotogota bacterium]
MVTENNKFNAIVIDIDGTFIDDNEELPADNLSILNFIIKKGLNVIFCSGRMLQSVETFLQSNIGSMFPIISYNGAMVKLNDRIILDKKISSSLASSIVKEALKEGLYIQAYVNDELYVSEDNKKADDYARHSSVEYHIPKNILDFVKNHEPTKLLIIDEAEELETIAEKFRRRFSGVEIVRSFPTYLDIIPSNTDKGKALKVLCEKMGILPEKIVVFGDNNNDVAAFKVAGLSVAMGNGTKVVKENADIIAPTNNDAGFAKIVKSLFRKNYF